MVVHSIANNSYVTLASGASFEGGIEVTTQGVSICVSTFCSSEVKVIIKQYRQNAASTIMHSNEENVVADTKGLVQTPVKAGFFSIKVENLGSNMTFTNITTVLQETHYINLDIRSLTGARDSVTIAGGTIDISGNQDVTVTSRSGTGFLSYLNDNVAVATMPAITGTVAVSSQPHLSYLTDNVAVATQPALAFSTDKVDATGSSVSVSNLPATQPVSGSVSVSNLPATQPVSGSVSVSNFPATQPVSGTVAVSSQPALSYLTDNVAVATMPPITGTVAVSSMPFLSYLTSNIAVATQPALVFSTDKVDATGSAVTISSGAVTISAALPTGTNSIGTVITDERPASSAPFVTGITQGTSITISSTANTQLISINPVNQGAVTTIAWYKLYNGLNKQSTDTADLVTTIGITSSLNNTNPEIHLSSLLFPNGCSVRVTGSSSASDNSAPTGTQSLTAVIYV